MLSLLAKVVVPTLPPLARGGRVASGAHDRSHLKPILWTGAHCEGRISWSRRDFRTETVANSPPTRTFGSMAVSTVGCGNSLKRFRAARRLFAFNLGEVCHGRDPVRRRGILSKP